MRLMCARLVDKFLFIILNMKHLLNCMLVAMALLAMPSCSSKGSDDAGGSGTGATATLKFTSTTEAIDGESFVWSAYDVLCVNGEGTTSGTEFELQSGSGKTSAVFSGKMQTAPHYYAFCPASAVQSVNDGSFAFELPRKRTTGTSVREAGDILRAADGTPESGFEFRNILGYAEFRLTGSGSVSSVKLSVSSSSPAISGVFTYDAKQQTLTATSASNNSAVGSLSRAITLSSTPQSVFFALPEGRYSDVTLTLSGDKSQQYIVKGNVVVERSSVVTVSDLELNEDFIDVSFIGDWHLTKFCNAAVDADIYLSLNDDDSFKLYQRAFDNPLAVYQGTYEFDGTTISGVYNDGVAWSASYTVAMNGDDTMIWTNTSTNEVSVYERCELPNLTEKNSTRSATDVKRFL